jgi:hypothetical protein
MPPKISKTKRAKKKPAVKKQSHSKRVDLHKLREKNRHLSSKLSKTFSESLTPIMPISDIKLMLTDKSDYSHGVHIDRKNPQINSSEGGLLDPTTVYTFLLKGYSTISVPASGIIAQFIPFDPSSTGFNFAEWSTLSSLFAEFKLRRFAVQFVGNTNTTGAQAYGPVAIGSNISYSSAPTSTGQVISQADGIFWKGANHTTDRGYTHTVHPGNIGWSLVSSPTNTPYAGAPGCIQIYGTNTGVSCTYALARVMGWYEFRVRN